MISAIIVAYNEEECITSIIRELRKQQYPLSTEIILADGGSTDQTVSLATAEKIKVISCRKGRACQMNDAAKVAKGDIFFFVHADMTFPAHTFQVIEEHISQQDYDGGGFANLFDRHNEKIKKLGTLMNFRFLDRREQSDKGVFYGDNGIFVKKSVFEKLGGFREIPIMEDYDFSLRMKAQFRSIKIKEPSITVSARRHEKAGFIKTRLQWILIRKLFNYGVSPKWLARWYRDVR